MSDLRNPTDNPRRLSVLRQRSSLYVSQFMFLQRVLLKFGKWEFENDAGISSELLKRSVVRIE